MESATFLKRHSAQLAAAITLSALVAGSARADIINVEVPGQDQPPFGALPVYTGAAAIGSAGDQWNLITATRNSTGPFVDSSLVNASGTPVAGISATIGNAIYNPSGTYANGANILTHEYDVTNSTATYNGGIITAKVSGLPANSPYDVYIIGTNAVGAGSGFALGNDVSGSVSATKTTSGADGFVEGGSYVHYATTSDSNGNLFFEATPIGSPQGLAILNGFQISGAVPEPTGLALMSFGLVGLLRRRTRTA